MKMAIRPHRTGGAGWAFETGMWRPSQLSLLASWTDWTSVRKVKDGETTDSLFGFLTCDANETVGAVHPKAMPVILTEQSDVEGWLCAETGDALKLQWPLQEGLLPIVEQPLSGSVV